jgi:hypothetical protein
MKTINALGWLESIKNTPNSVIEATRDDTVSLSSLQTTVYPLAPSDRLDSYSYFLDYQREGQKPGRDATSCLLEFEL